MTINYKVRDEKLQYDLDREAVKISENLENLIKMNILQVKEYCYLIKLE